MTAGEAAVGMHAGAWGAQVLLADPRRDGYRFRGFEERAAPASCRSGKRRPLRPHWLLCY